MKNKKALFESLQNNDSRKRYETATAKVVQFVQQDVLIASSFTQEKGGDTYKNDYATWFME